MTKADTTENLDNIFEALAHKHRRTIIHVLSLQPASISQLASICNLSLPAVHKHIKILERANMVIRKKVGRTNFLTRNRDSLHALHTWLAQYQTYWGSNEDSLENYVKYLADEKSTERRWGK